MKKGTMKTLTETTLFILFVSYSKREEAILSDLPKAYDEFAFLLSEIPIENDRIGYLRMLNYTRVELFFLKQHCETLVEEKHIMYDVFINKTLALLEMEIQIVKDFFQENRMTSTYKIENNVLSVNRKRNITLTWNGTDNDLIELVAALMAAGAIGSMDAHRVTIVDVIRFFENAFHLKINALYTKRGKVFDRCTDTTPFIDSLRNSYNRMLEERLA